MKGNGVISLLDLKCVLWDPKIWFHTWNECGSHLFIGEEIHSFSLEPIALLCIMQILFNLRLCYAI